MIIAFSLHVAAPFACAAVLQDVSDICTSPSPVSCICLAIEDNEVADLIYDVIRRLLSTYSVAV